MVAYTIDVGWLLERIEDSARWAMCIVNNDNNNNKIHRDVHCTQTLQIFCLFVIWFEIVLVNTLFSSFS